jgi:signal transduction histidine kinase
MSAWLPRSLFSRMVLVLLTGLVLAQGAGLWIYWRDRDEFMQRAFGMRSVQRIADIIRVVDPMPAAERTRIVGILNSPQLRIAFDVPQLAQNDERPDNQTRLFSSALRRALGDDRELLVKVAEAPFIKGPPAGHAPGMMKGAMIGAPMGGGGPFAFGTLSFVVQTRLHDGALITLDSRQSVDAAAWPYRLFVSLAIVLATVIAVAMIAVRWVTRPLKTLAKAAEELGENIDRPPLDETGPAEVTRAARAFNTMQQRLMKLIGERARIFAAMSHDLKTPITRLRLRAELLDDVTVREKFERDLGEMEQMVSDALDLVRGLDKSEPAKAVDLMSLLRNLADDAKLAGGEVHVQGAATRFYVGKARLLRRCFGNLIDNALKYAGAATIDVAEDTRALRIAVRDSGPGIPEADLERVFEPFYRLEHSRNRGTGGTGLGLTIARDIVRAHGGELVLRNRPQGGLEALVTLPQ